MIGFLAVLVISAPINVAAVGVNFSDAHINIAPLGIEQVFFNSEVSVRKYFYETSYGKVEIKGNVHVVYIDTPLSNCDAFYWRDLALKSLEEQKVDTLQYDLFSFVLPPNEKCEWAGLGEQPGRYTWVNPEENSGIKHYAEIAVHEIGHNLNMYHACQTVCKADGKIVPLSNDCITHQYGNQYDTMGIPLELPHQSVPNKLATGWLGEEDIEWVKQDGEYRLVPLEMTKGVRGLVLRRPSGDFLVFELRSQIGFDSEFENPGVLVYLTVPGDSQCRGRLLDMHPKVAGFFDEALKLGESFTDPLSNVKLTIKELSYQHAVVAFEGIPIAESSNPSIKDLDFYEESGCSYAPSGRPGLFLILLVGLLIRRKFVA